jgi:hypothetical protein
MMQILKTQSCPGSRLAKNCTQTEAQPCYFEKKRANQHHNLTMEVMRRKRAELAKLRLQRERCIIAEKKVEAKAQVRGRDNSGFAGRHARELATSIRTLNAQIHEAERGLILIEAGVFKKAKT